MTGTQTRNTTSPRPRRQTTRIVDPRDRRRTAGRFLLDSIEVVLPFMTAPTEGAAAARPLVDDLRTALAQTAARGDTCLVSEAAECVRTAAHLLLAGSTEEANEALRKARADLTR